MNNFRYYIDLLSEAAYDSLVTAMKTQYPDKVADIDAQVKWAKTSLKKADRITWYLKIVRVFLSGPEKLKPLLGSYQFKDITSFSNDLIHYYGFNSPKIEAYTFTNQTVEKAFSDLTSLEQEFQKTQKLTKPVTAKMGDYKIFSFPDGSAWWWVDRAYCPEEGRSGEHCGNVVGKHQTDQRILSYRIKDRVILTFILESDGMLGEMKAKNNQKPQEKYHSAIVHLLLNFKQITGIRSGGYAPEQNFNIFDLNDSLLKQVYTEKPQLISSQLKYTPVDILRAPEWIRADNALRDIVVKSSPAIGNLIAADGKVQTSTSNWEQAIANDRSLIIHAPVNIDNFKKRVVDVIARDPKLVMSAPRHIRTDLEILKPAVEENPSVLGGISPNIPGYRDLVLAVVQENGYALFYASEELKNDPKIVLAAVQHDVRALEYASPELKNDPKIVLAAVQHDVRALRYAGEEMKNNPTIVLAAVQQDGLALEYASEELRNNPKIVLAAIQKNTYALSYAGEEMKNNPTIVLAAVEQSGEALRHASKKLRNDPTIVLAAIQRHGGEILFFAGEEMKNNPTIVLAAVQQEGSALSYASEEMKNNPQIVLAAVQQQGMALKYASKELRNDPKVVLAAIQKNTYALSYASEELQNDPKIVLAAVQQSGIELRHASPELRNDPKIVLAAVQKDRRALAYASKELRNDPEFLKLINKSKTSESVLRLRKLAGI